MYTIIERPVKDAADYIQHIVWTAVKQMSSSTDLSVVATLSRRVYRLRNENIVKYKMNRTLAESNDVTRKVLTKVIFSLTATLALVGNFLVLLLFARCPSWLKKKHYQCILNLAVTDILTAISLLVVPKFVQEEDVYTVPLGNFSREFYCRIVWSHFIPFSLGITSVYTCLVLAVERWLAVFRPVIYKLKFGMRTMQTLILCTWFAGIAFESPIIPRVEGYQDPNTTTAKCKWIVETNQQQSWTLAIVLFAGQTFIPCCLIVLAYVHIFTRYNLQYHLDSKK